MRIILTSILFSNPVTLFFSLVGGIFAYSGLLISSRAYDKNISFIGISVFCAALHNFGQNIAAIITFTSFSAISYLPYLLLLSVPTGIISGVILELVFKKVKKLL